MKKALNKAMLPIILLCLSSCAKEETADIGRYEGAFDIVAVPRTMRTSNDGLDTKWSANDSVHVWHKATGSQDYVDDGLFVLTDPETGTFSGVLASALEGSGTYDWKMSYPYSGTGSVQAGAAWHTQQGNSSTAHLCGHACPLEGVLSSCPAGTTPRIHLKNLASVVKVAVTNQNDYDLTVNTVKVNSYTLQVADPQAISKGKSADFYVPVAPFTGKASISVDGYSRTTSAEVSCEAGAIHTVSFSYDNQDKAVTDVTVWDSDRYSSFTDIIYFGRKYYCAFREAGGHVAHNVNEKGKIIVRSSDDCISWSDELEISNGFDLRDPLFVASPDSGRLMLYYGMATLSGNDDAYFPNPCNQMCELATDATGRLKLISQNNVRMVNGTMDKSQYWLWGITEHGGTYYGIAYYLIDKGYPTFFKSTDGINFTQICEVNVRGNEASICFVGERAYIFFRSIERPDAIVTYADPPYTRWTKNTTTYEGMQMHCPETVCLWGKIYVCMRGNTHGVPIYVYDPETKRFEFVHDVYANTSTDRAYPGMIVRDDAVHVVYYAYKVKAQNIYYQRIPLNLIHDLTEKALR